MMDFLRFLASIPGRLLAVLLGVTILPLRLLLGIAVQLVLSAIVALVIAIAIPVLIGYFFAELGLSKIANFLINALIILPVVTVVAAIALAGFTIATLYQGFFSLFKTIYLGFTSGLSGGLEGFARAYREQASPITVIIQSVSAFINRRAVAREQQIDDVGFDGFQQIVGELVDVAVPARVHDVPDMEQVDDHGTDIEAGGLLTPQEVEGAKTLMQSLTRLSNPLSPELKLEIDRLKVRFEHYTDLSDRLNKVKACLQNGNLDEIEDQLIPYTDVEEPILFFKQYQKDGQWHSVPAQAYVTNKEGLLTWLKTKPNHPLSRDVIKQPSAYQLDGAEYTTRYQWHTLTADNCSAAELSEGAQEIRALLASLPAKIQASESNTSSVLSGFFGASRPSGETTGSDHNPAFTIM